MNLVFVHGCCQGTRQEQDVRDTWTAGLLEGFRKIGYQPPQLETLVPFYGAELDRLAAERAASTVRVIERGDPAGDIPVDPFAAAIIERMAERAGVDRQQVIREAGVSVVERGPERWGWFQALARATSRRAPWLINFGIGQFVADVNAYLTRPHIQKRVHEIVSPAIQRGPCIIVSHSLGTVVMYRLLSDLTPTPEVRLLVTAGSPLGIDVIKAKFPPPLRFPAGVKHWLNASDERDCVALYARLDRQTFVEGIENVSDIDNGDSPHAICRYLSDTTVARRIADALSA